MEEYTIGQFSKMLGVNKETILIIKDSGFTLKEVKNIITIQR